MRIIGFNGPPRSGKDTLAKAIEYIHDDEVRFKPFVEGREPEYSKWAGPWGHPASISLEALIMPCRVAAFALLGLGDYDPTVYEHTKDQPLEQIGGLTLRQFMISLSENFLKIKFGRGFYGNALKSKLHHLSPTAILNNEELLLVTDIGFQEEVDILSDLVDPANFLLVHTVRKGTTFEGDSRGWCYHENIYKAWNTTPTPETGAFEIMTYAHNALGWEF